jgi:hypothetical protein
MARGLRWALVHRGPEAKAVVEPVRVPRVVGSDRGSS